MVEGIGWKFFSNVCDCVRLVGEEIWKEAILKPQADAWGYQIELGVVGVVWRKLVAAECRAKCCEMFGLRIGLGKWVRFFSFASRRVK